MLKYKAFLLQVLSLISLFGSSKFNRSVTLLSATFPYSPSNGWGSESKESQQVMHSPNR